MTQVWQILQQTLSDNAFWLNRLAALLWRQKHLHTDRFAADHEVKSLAHQTSYGLVLGLDRFGRLLMLRQRKSGHI
jgi:hypothetical protein